MKFALALVFLVIVGFWFRVNNLLPYKFYPDSYVSILVARNIQINQLVIGNLGEKGYFFPKFFMWSRPVYPVLINLFNVIFHEPFEAAKSTNLLLGLSSIVL